MRISSQLLTKLRALRDARNASEVLPACINIASFKDARKRIWQEIRATYNLPSQLKFKVELDGAAAGELRRKDTSAPYTPVSAPSVPTAAPQTSDGQRFLVIGDDAETPVHGVAALLTHLRNEYDLRIVQL